VFILSNSPVFVSVSVPVPDDLSVCLTPESISGTGTETGTETGEAGIHCRSERVS
jgi:hypothetical protein